jgi:hypothetical protein
MAKHSPFQRRIDRVNRAYPISGLPKSGTAQVSSSAIDVERVTRGKRSMSKFCLPLVFFAIIAVPLAATPANAQFGSIFGNDPPPRPPQAVPGRQQQPPQQPQQRSEEPPRTLQPPGPPSRPGQQPGNIQTQPLPPPPGGASAPGVSVTPAQPPAGGSQPAQRPGRGAPQQPQPQQPADAGVPPNDEVATEPPGNKVPNPTSVFAGLDKITGRITSFDVALNETVQFGALQVTPRACYTRPPTETPHTDAFIEVDEVTLQGEIRRIYTGWMFAASPGLHAVEHPIYDIWLTDCKGGAVAEAAPEPEAPSPRTTRSQQQQRQPAAQQQQRQSAPQQRRPPQQPF